MKSKTIFLAILAVLFSLKGFSQEQVASHWSDIPSGVYKLVLKGEVRVIIKKDSKRNHYDFGTDVKDYISSGQEKEGSSFKRNGQAFKNNGGARGNKSCTYGQRQLQGY